MIDDIMSLPEIVKIDGKEYKIEYTCKSYGILEAMTGKSTFEIKDLLFDGKLGIMDCIEVICAGLTNNHTDSEITTVRDFIKDNLYVLQEVNMEVMKAFIKPLLPPEIYQKLLEAKKELTKIIESGDKIKKKSKKKAT